jgi:hypothetical protein
MKKTVIFLLFFSITACLSLPYNDETGRSYTMCMGLQLEVSKLDDCIVKFGKAKIIESGVSPDSAKSINYFFKSENAYVIFEVREMGSNENLSSVVMTLSRIDEPFTTINNFKFSKDDFGSIRLGMKKDNLKSVFRNVNWSRNAVEVWFKNKVPRLPGFKDQMSTSGDGTYYEENIIIRMIFTDDLLTTFYVEKKTTS